MARRETVITYCDITGEEGATRLDFGLDGVEYEIDLTDKHAAELRETLAPYIAHGRRVRSAAKVKTSPGVADSDAKVVRAWAVEHGYSVPPRGRIPGVVRQAYVRQHSGG